MAERKVPDMSNAHMDGDRPACEEPEPSFENYANMRSAGHLLGYEVIKMSCVKCKLEIPSPSSFRTPGSLRRYMMSGVCQVCQDLDDRKARLLAKIRKGTR